MNAMQPIKLKVLCISIIESMEGQAGCRIKTLTAHLTNRGVTERTRIIDPKTGVKRGGLNLIIRRLVQGKQ